MVLLLHFLRSDAQKLARLYQFLSLDGADEKWRAPHLMQNAHEILDLLLFQHSDVALRTQYLSKQHLIGPVA